MNLRAHLVRRDYLVNLVQRAVETLLFYHPAVWWCPNASVLSGNIKVRRPGRAGDYDRAELAGGLVARRVNRRDSHNCALAADGDR